MTTSNTTHQMITGVSRKISKRDYPQDDATIGGARSVRFQSFRIAMRSDSNPVDVLRNFSDKYLKEKAVGLLLTIEESILWLNSTEKDISNLPSLKVFTPDDGSVLFEFTTRNLKAGFTLEPSPKESGWYFVLTSDDYHFGVSRYFPETISERNIIPILLLILNNV
jgi:hypothetical protein